MLRQGDVGDKFYVARSGEYDMGFVDGDAPVHRYKSGAAFGELSLLYDKVPASAGTVTCVGTGTLYQLDRTAFRALVVMGTRDALDRNYELLKRVPVFDGLTDKQLHGLVALMEVHCQGSIDWEPHS